MTPHHRLAFYSISPPRPARMLLRKCLRLPSFLNCQIALVSNVARFARSPLLPGSGLSNAALPEYNSPILWPEHQINILLTLSTSKSLLTFAVNYADTAPIFFFHTVQQSVVGEAKHVFCGITGKDSTRFLIKDYQFFTGRFLLPF